MVVAFPGCEITFNFMRTSLKNYNLKHINIIS
jgi:hypothetical protein